jgi:diguanylate cyclase (GGDEF)-like protein
MGPLFRHILAAILAVLALFGLSSPAAAGSFAPGSTCRIYLAPGETPQAAERSPERWNCGSSGWRVESGEALVRFDLRGRGPDDLPRFLVTRAALFSRLTLTMTGQHGEQRSRVVTPETIRIADGFARMAAPLPMVGSAPVAVIADFKGPRFAGTVVEAELVAREPFGWAGPLDIAVMLICGLLIAPILFDIVYFRVLRERFLLLHAVTGTLMLGHAALCGGLLARLMPVSLAQFQLGMTWTFSFAIATGAIFYRDFIEPEAIGPRHRKMLGLAALLCLVLAVLQTASPFPATIMQPIYYAGWVPIAGIITWALVTTLGRGSRAAVFQAVAWLPLLLTGLIRIFGNLGVSDQPVDAFFGFFISIGFEVVVTALGVADRFMSIKRDRDSAKVEVRMLGELAERDPLTGLLNRRAIEPRFAELLTSGYSTIAVIDIDHFKTINDSRGHVTGDQVLRVVAEVLVLDNEALAVRLGGEEFMLLLRGRDAARRAEHIRTALPTRIAAQVPGLDGLVTASMGLVELPRHGRIRQDFASLYAQCDRLLYEAKNTGRNRTMMERMQSFGEGRRGRDGSVAA